MHSAFQSDDTAESGSFLHAARRLAASVAYLMGERTGRIAAVWRGELHRMMAVFVLSFALMVFVCTAAVFVAFALFMTLWENHKVLAPAAAAGVFVLLAAATGLIIARKTRILPARH